MTTHSKSLLALWLGVFLAVAAVPAMPAVAAEKEPIVKPMGMPIPSFFFSGPERRQREACAARLPECRPSVRVQMEQEMEYSLIFPWAAAGIALLGVLLWLRSQEQKKLKLRQKAQRRYDSSTYRKLDKTKEEREEDERKRREREELRADL